MPLSKGHQFRSFAALHVRQQHLHQSRPKAKTWSKKHGITLFKDRKWSSRPYQQLPKHLYTDIQSIRSTSRHIAKLLKGINQSNLPMRIALATFRVILGGAELHEAAVLTIMQLSSCDMRPEAPDLIHHRTIGDIFRVSRLLTSMNPIIATISVENPLLRHLLIITFRHTSIVESDSTISTSLHTLRLTKAMLDRDSLVSQEVARQTDSLERGIGYCVGKMLYAMDTFIDLDNAKTRPSALRRIARRIQERRPKIEPALIDISNAYHEIRQCS